MSSLVCVMMSTYNGSAYIEQQIESVLAQDHSDIKLIVRDDGSSDSTVDILRSLQGASRFEFVPGRNVGIKASFFELLKIADESADYYAFCDQDDFWLPDKISRALERLANTGSDAPVLYCSAVGVVDSDLRTIREDIVPQFSGIGGLLVENFAIGCTVVISRGARNLILRHSSYDFYMHDWWATLLVCCFGRIVCDNESRIKYRQHEGNVVGVHAKLIDRIVGFSRFLFSLTTKFDAYSQVDSLLRVLKKERVSSEVCELCLELMASRNSFFKRLGLVHSRKLVWKPGVRGLVKKMHYIAFGVIR